MKRAEAAPQLGRSPQRCRTFAAACLTCSVLTPVVVPGRLSAMSVAESGGGVSERRRFEALLRCAEWGGPCDGRRCLLRPVRRLLLLCRAPLRLSHAPRLPQKQDGRLPSDPAPPSSPSSALEARSAAAMSKQRKLQSEIDATLRKIADGVQEWDELWNKLDETEVRSGACSWGLALPLAQAGRPPALSPLPPPGAATSAAAAWPCRRTPASVKRSP